VATSIGSHLYSLQMHSERLQSQVSHFDRETSSFRQGGLLKGDTAAECSFKSATDAAFDVVDHERLEQAVYLVPNGARYVEVRPAVQRGSAIVRIEEIDAKARYGERRRLAARRRTGDDEHPGRHLPAEIAIGAFPHILRQVLTDALTVAVSDAQAL
jgi:hypothetical protein